MTAFHTYLFLIAPLATEIVQGRVHRRSLVATSDSEMLRERQSKVQCPGLAFSRAASSPLSCS